MPIILGGDKGKRKNKRTLQAVRISRSNRKRYRDNIIRFINLMDDISTGISQSIDDGLSKQNIASQIDQGIDRTTREINNNVDSTVDSFVTDTNKQSKKRLEDVIKSSMSVTFAEILDEPNVAEHLEIAKVENVSLIKSISSDHWNKVIRAVSNNFTGIAQPDNQSLNQRIKEIGDISQNRADLIARDQTSKLTGDLTRIRHENIGIDTYRWRNAQDQRVVGNPIGLYPKGNRVHGDHWGREGKEYNYSSPPGDGNPGQPINCRCYAEPILNLDDLDATWVG